MPSLEALEAQGLMRRVRSPGFLGKGDIVFAATEAGRELAIAEEKSLLLQHLLLSHHGEPDFGAAVRPMCAEAELLSYIDLIDSRMEIYAETLPGVPAGGFSGRIFALEKKIYHHN